MPFIIYMNRCGVITDGSIVTLAVLRGEARDSFMRHHQPILDAEICSPHSHSWFSYFGHTELSPVFVRP